MKIVFDNIIYSLQRSGGGSVYWTELLKRFSVINNDNIFFDQKEPTDNIFRKTLQLNPVKQESKFSLNIRRYIPFTEEIKEVSSTVSAILSEPNETAKGEPNKGPGIKTGP